MIASQMPRRVQAATSKLSNPFSAALTIPSRGQAARNASSTRIRHEDDQRVGVAGTPTDFGRIQRLARLVQHRLAHSGARWATSSWIQCVTTISRAPRGAHRKCRRRRAPSPSTSVTIPRMTRMMAETSRYSRCAATRSAGTRSRRPRPRPAPSMRGTWTPAIKDHVRHLRHHLRKIAVDDDLDRRRARRADRFDRLFVDVLQRLGEQLADHADGVKAQRQGAGSTPKPTAATNRTPMMSSGN